MCDIEHTRHRSPINFADNDRVLLLNAIDESSQIAILRGFSGLIFVEFRLIDFLQNLKHVKITERNGNQKKLCKEDRCNINTVE